MVDFFVEMNLLAYSKLFMRTSPELLKVIVRAGGDIKLFITIVPKVFLFLIRWLSNFGGFY